MSTKLVPGICPNCGGHVKVDPESDAAVCEYCGTPFIVERAITNFNTTINNTNIQVGSKGAVESVTDYLKHKDDLKREKEKAEEDRKAEQLRYLQSEAGQAERKASNKYAMIIFFVFLAMMIIGGILKSC